MHRSGARGPAYGTIVDVNQLTFEQLATLALRPAIRRRADQQPPLRGGDRALRLHVAGAAPTSPACIGGKPGVHRYQVNTARQDGGLTEALESRLRAREASTNGGAMGISLAVALATWSPAGATSISMPQFLTGIGHR
jgi:hypothetical protein